MLSAVEVVSRAVKKARQDGKADLVRQINHDINVHFLPFEDIIERYQLDESQADV